MLHVLDRGFGCRNQPLSDNFVFTCFLLTYTELTNKKSLWRLDGFSQYICREVL
jgi:hypothetical protein